MEGCLKSHFSHIRNKGEKVTLRPFILERALETKSSPNQENIISESSQKSNRFWIGFCIDLGFILDPIGHPNIAYFLGHFGLGVALGPSWRHDGPQSAPRQPQRLKFREFDTILGSISKGFLKIFKCIFDTIPYSISLCMSYFRRYYNNALSTSISNLHFSARWRLDARSALDNYICICVYIYMYRYIYIYVYTRHARIYLHIISIHIEINTCMYMYMYLFIYIYI